MHQSLENIEDHVQMMRGEMTSEVPDPVNEIISNRVIEVPKDMRWNRKFLRNPIPKLVICPNLTFEFLPTSQNEPSLIRSTCSWILDRMEKALLVLRGLPSVWKKRSRRKLACLSEVVKKSHVNLQVKEALASRIDLIPKQWSTIAFPINIREPFLLMSPIQR